MAAQGHPRAIFKPAVEHGNLLVAEMTARELGRITLAEALELVCLYAEAEPAKFERAALRWHARFVAESGPPLLQAQIALAAPVARLPDRVTLPLRRHSVLLDLTQEWRSG